MDNKYSLKIFVVDTDPFCLNIYKQQLANIGYRNVRPFTNAPECLDNLVEKPDVVFLDYRMDVVAELGILKRIKKFNPDIYVVFTSTPEDVETVTNSLKHGAFDFAIKKDSGLERVGKILSTIYEIGELLKTAQPSYLKKFPG